jgi:predicted RND superfamily exporter protein
MKKFFSHPWAIIIVCLAITGVLGFKLKDVKLDNSVRQFFPQKHPSYQRLINTEDTFGSTVVIGVSLETDKGSIITADNIAIIDRITQQISRLDNVDGVDSLTSIDYIYGKDNALVAGNLIGVERGEDGLYPRLTDEQVEKVKENVSSWSDMYSRVIVSDDGRAVQMQVTLKSDNHPDPKVKKESDEVIRQRTLNSIREITKKETEGSGLSVIYYGDPVLTESSRAFMLSDLERLIPLVVLVVLLTLFFSFKTLDGTLLPLIAVLMATIWTCGFMAAFHFTFTIVTSVIPVALIACGSAYGIHVLTHYYIALDNFKGTLTKEAHKEIIIAGLKDVWIAVFLAALTTVIGFISLVTSPIGPLHSFAIFTALGIAFSLVLAVTFIPALLMVKPLSKVGYKSKHMEKMTNKVRAKMTAKINHLSEKAGRKEGDSDSDPSALYNIYRFFCGSKARLAVFCIAIVVVSAVGIARLHVDTALINYFPENCKMRKDVAYVDKRFAGTNSLYILVKGPAQKDDKGNVVKDGKGNIVLQPGSMTKPEILEPVDAMQTYLSDKYESVGKIVSFTTFIKRMNQVMHIPTAGAAPAPAAPSASASSDASSDFSDDFGSDFGGDFGSADTAAPAQTASVPSDYVDPNIAYSQALAQPMTVQDGLDMLADAYADAGGKKATVQDIVNVLEKRLNYNGTAYYEIPYDTKKYPVASREELSDLVSQYLLLFSGSLGRFADNALQPSCIRIQVQFRSHSTEEMGHLIADTKAYAAKHFPEGYTIEFTGPGEMEYTMTEMVVSSQMQSLMISLISVFIVIAISFGSGWAGLLGAVPLAFAIILNYMTMGFAHINLDLVTSIIASVAVGVGIDYTIHFLETYRAERALSNDVELVTKRTFKKSGVGIITNALAVGLGFLVLYFSKFVVLQYIGILVAIVMFTSSALAMTVIPGFLTAFDPKFIRPKDNPEDAAKAAQAEQK